MVCSSGGKHLHYTYKPMTNNELTLDQLTAMAGGSAFVKLGDIKGNMSNKTSQDIDTDMNQTSDKVWIEDVKC